jgi:ATP-dependent Lon protease
MVESVHIGLAAVNVLLPSSQRLCGRGTGGVVVNFQGSAKWKKEGSSAGLAVALSLVSLAVARPLPKNLAASGEISLTGRVHPVSKVADKVLVWERNGVTRSVLPTGNREDSSMLSARLDATHRTDAVSTLAEACFICGLLDHAS